MEICLWEFDLTDALPRFLVVVPGLGPGLALGIVIMIWCHLCADIN